MKLTGKLRYSNLELGVGTVVEQEFHGFGICLQGHDVQGRPGDTAYMVVPKEQCRNKDTKTKSRHLKKLTCKETLRRVFNITVYRLEMESVMLVFSTQLCKLLPLSPSLWFTSPFPVSKYNIYRQ